MSTETARFSARHATLPPGFGAPGWFLPLARFAARSQTLRKLMVHWIPRTRLRMVLVSWWWSWMIERFASGEAEGVIEVFDPECECVMFDQLETYHGRDGFITMWSEVMNDFGEGAFALEEFIDVDGGGPRFVAITRSTAIGNRSGLSLDQLGKVCVVATVARGNAAGVRLYQSKAAALEAVGLTGTQ